MLRAATGRYCALTGRRLSGRAHFRAQALIQHRQSLWTTDAVPAFRWGRAMSSQPANDSSANSIADKGRREFHSPTANVEDERRWNRLSSMMKQFHDYLKAEFELVYEMADGSYTKRGQTTKMYLGEAAGFKQHLTMHHTIEERHVFPVLATRMPEFKNDDVHVKSHHAIHEGLDKLGVLLTKWNKEPSAYSPQEMRECLDSWREVLFAHLDEEVSDLSGENMKKYWKLEELDRLVM